MRGRRRARAGAAAVALALLAGACSGDDAGDGGDGVVVTTSTTAVDPSTTTSAARRDLDFGIGPPMTAEELGSSWREGCPVAPEDLRTVEVTHRGFDGADHQGQLVVAADVAQDVLDVFVELFRAAYPIERIEPVTAYRSDDITSVLANNTSAFNCRFATGSSTRWSEHAFGRAIDLNPLVNPYVTSSGVVIPGESAPYLDRGRDDQGMVQDGDPAVVEFEARGWVWGGHWRSSKDYQHFSTTGR